MNRIDSPSGRVHFSIDPYPDDEHETVMAEVRELVAALDATLMAEEGEE